MFKQITDASLQEEFLLFFQNSRFHHPTSFQETVIPHMVSNDDLIINTAHQKGKTAAFLIPAIVQHEQKTLILTQTEADLRKVKTQLGILSSHTHVSIISANTYRKSLSSSNSSIIIGTAKHFIDYYRQKEAALREIKRFIAYSDNPDSRVFAADIDFIASKLPYAQKAYFLNGLSQQELYLTNNPKAMLLAAAKQKKQQAHWGTFDYAKDLIQYFQNLTLKKQYKTIRLLSSVKLAKKLHEVFQNDAFFMIETMNDKNLKSSVEILLSSRLIKNQSSETTVFFTNVTDIHDVNAFLYNWNYEEFYFLYTNKKKEIINTIKKEFSEMKNNETENASNKDAVKGAIEIILTHIKEVEDPSILDNYRKIFRKNVPIFMRSYIAAYLLKERMGDKRINSVKNKISSKKKSALLKQEDNSETKTLFVSIGKNKRVYPKDLSRFLSQSAELDSETIKRVRVLDNYSFVEVEPAYADTYISKADGALFRGRKITVNMARKKD